MEAKNAIMVFPALADRCMADVKVSDIDLSHLKSVPEATIYKELFEELKDETLDDAKRIVTALSGAIQEAETTLSFETKIEDLNIKIFNEIETKTDK